MTATRGRLPLSAYSRVAISLAVKVESESYRERRAAEGRAEKERAVDLSRLKDTPVQ